MYPEDINVDSLEMKKANYPDTLSSGGLGPCIAIGVFDPKTRSGYMMHEPHFRSVDLDGKINEIRKDYGDLTRLRVFATGNSLSSYESEGQRKFERSNRLYVEQTLRKYFRDSQLQIRWMPDDHNVVLFLDTSTGEFELYVQSLDEMLE
jgi:hypothetical protein